jgi:hypothetical protein
MNDLSPDKRHSLIIDIVGKREDRDITSRLEPIFFGAAADLEPEPGAETEPQENTLASTENHTDQTEHASISTEAEHLAEATEEPGNNILILIETLIFNIIIAGLIFVLYKKYKSKLQFNNPLEELPNE